MVKRIFYKPNHLLILLIFLGISLRLAVIADKKVLEYDDAISILAATGHEGEYAEIFSNHTYPLGTWVSASTWMRLTEFATDRGFVQIAKDLSLYDIHPPLYFWILHAWIASFGNSLWSTHLLNILIDLLVALALSIIGYQIFHNSTEALWVSALWVLNPVGIKMSFWMRQYTLLTFILLLFAFLLFKSFYSDRQIRWLTWSNFWLGLTILAGLLTHYYFVIFILAGLVLIGRLRFNFHTDRRLLFVLAGVLSVSGLLFLFIFPNFSYSFIGFLTSRLSFFTNLSEVNDRILNASKTALLLFSPFLAASSLLLGRHSLNSWSRDKGFAPDQRSKMSAGVLQTIQDDDAHGLKCFLASLSQIPFFRWSVFFAVLPFLIILMIYLAGISQVHTFSSRYLGFITPFVAVVTTFLFQGFKNRARVVALFAGGVISLGLLTLTPGIAQSQQGWIDQKSLRNANFVVIDGVEPGTWPAIVLGLNRDQNIFIDSQENLAQHPEQWLDHFGDEAGIYVSILRGRRNTPDGRRQILAAIEARYQVEELSKIRRPEDWEITLYRVK